MKRYRVNIAIRNPEEPHIDTIANYHVHHDDEQGAMFEGLRIAREHDALDIRYVRRITVTMQRMVEP
jgi:hypothetical protein